MPTENRSSNTGAPFQREDRYIVIKRSDLDRLPGLQRHLFSQESRRAHEQMFAAGAPARQFLVIESDWPEYEPTWAAIEARVTGKPTEQHQGEPAAVLYANGSVLTKADCGDAFEICCKVETPLYTHANAGEVERLRAWGKANQDLAQSCADEVEALRAKLAEQEHSARELLRIIGMSVQGSAAYNRAVVAFHDSLNADTKPN